MERLARLIAFAALPLLAAPAACASAEVLLVERVRAETGALPARGLDMAQVRARFGEPMARLEPRGGQKPQWPVIHRWTYPGFTVYFERDKVIDAVANTAGIAGPGPLPPAR